MTRAAFKPRLLLCFLLVLVAATTAWGVSDQARSTDNRFVEPEAPQTSPTGDFVAHVEYGPEQNGVKTWVVVIKDSSGAEQFRDTYAYSIRHGVGVTQNRI